MNDAAPGGHPVDVAGCNRLQTAKTVPVDNRAVEEIGHRGKTDMRMGPHVDAFAFHQFGRTYLVDENKRPDHLALCRRKHAPDLESSQVAGTRYDTASRALQAGAMFDSGSLAGCQLILFSFLDEVHGLRGGPCLKSHYTPDHGDRFFAALSSRSRHLFSTILRSSELKTLLFGN